LLLFPQNHKKSKKHCSIIYIVTFQNLYLCTQTCICAGFKLECDTEISHAIIIARFVYFITLLKSARQAIELV
jgi:hypothetical protein